MDPTRAEEGAGTLTTDRWQQLVSLCHAALARPAAERAAFLVEACGGDESLRRVVSGPQRQSLRAQRSQERAPLRDYFSFGGPGNQSYDVSPDGTRFLMLEVVRPAPRLDVVQGWRRFVKSSEQ